MRGECTLYEPPLSHLKLIPEAAFAGDVAGVGDSLLLLQLSFLLQLLDAVIDARCCDACGIERLKTIHKKCVVHRTVSFDQSTKSVLYIGQFHLINPQKVCCTQDSFI